ncbi:bifunctional phosphoserine phosphatase/homoserine phosphotransferase ThrH [Candidatus Aerophobetes bacterium]|uniref:phosphoserine phosphatase n=1 Tax=Aerophobetes bacterium TaxID=2030807 RepID=A0A662DEV7_UNCAE|nr:MAG: bifunctional phosphoserine phosphatase/homoserine phosphotransferase ThrH [Candidatus Aerophobetes bacterium]
MDLEGVLVPEIWINFAIKTGIEELKMTTRDEPDYDKLMKRRIKILEEHNLKLKDIQEVIESIEPLEGAEEYLNWVRMKTQAVILSDTFYEFAKPLMANLNYPTLFCNSLIVDADGNIVDYRLRIKDGKKKAVVAFKGLGFEVVAIGDSYNDTTMLAEADRGILFRPPENVIEEFPQFPVMKRYQEIKEFLSYNYNL